MVLGAHFTHHKNGCQREAQTGRATYGKMDLLRFFEFEFRCYYLAGLIAEGITRIFH
jgi:hypothetical protein